MTACAHVRRANGLQCWNINEHGPCSSWPSCEVTPSANSEEPIAVCACGAGYGAIVHVSGHGGYDGHDVCGQCGRKQ